MSGPWTDAHCHLADARLDDSIEQVIERSRRAGVVGWIQGGVGPDDWERQRALQNRIGAGFHMTFGLHPWWVIEHSDAELDHALAALPDALADAVALGELGLDRHPKRLADASAYARQERAFEAQLDIGKRLGRPLVLHVVRAHQQALALLEKQGAFARGGLVHSFSGTAEDGERYIRLGFHLSLSGFWAHEPSRLQGLGRLPLDRITVETDAPDQMPKTVHAASNEPAHLPAIAAALAPIWQVSGKQLLDGSHARLQKLFGLPS